MDVYIKNKVWEREIIRKNENIIPRVGERVDFGYAPAPKVTDVVYDYKNNVVFVICGD